MTKKILIIEDDNVLQKSIKIALETEGYKVIQAFNGEDGLSKVEKENPDLILLDLILPKKSGFLVLQDIKKNEKYKNIPVIVSTVLSTESSASECEFLGASDYLLKSDYSLEDIIKKINKLLK